MKAPVLDNVDGLSLLRFEDGYVMRVRCAECHHGETVDLPVAKVFASTPDRGLIDRLARAVGKGVLAAAAKPCRCPP